MNTPEFQEKDIIGINGVGLEQLTHPHFNVWQDYFKKEYKFKPDAKIVLFLPCAAIKPYYNSPIHRSFNRIIDNYHHIHKIVISNAGLIPYEYCDKYPFDSYDWNPLFETPKIKKEYIRITGQRIFDFFDNKDLNREIKFLTYLRLDSESLKSLKMVFDQLKINLETIKISGTLHKTADTDLLLILDNNLKTLENNIIQILKK